jgi:hypothetical protein
MKRLLLEFQIAIVAAIATAAQPRVMRFNLTDPIGRCVEIAVANVRCDPAANC